MKTKTRQIAVKLVMAAALILVALSLSFSGDSGSPRIAASEVGEDLEARMEVLEGFISQTIDIGPDDWKGHADINLPEDMVIYRYVEDSLTMWLNRFPVINDEIGPKMVFKRLSRPNKGISSPLSELTEDFSFVNYGEKWYLAKTTIKGSVKVIAGLEIMNSADSRRHDGVNPRLSLGGDFSISPLAYSGGYPVLLNGKPVFKVIGKSMPTTSVLAHSMMIWLAIGLFVLAMLLHLANKRCLKRLPVVFCGLLAIICTTFLWGASIKDGSLLFSPQIYADGVMFNSLGNALIVTIGIFLSIFSFFLVTDDIYRKILSSKHPKLILVIYTCLVAAIIAGVLAYSFFLFRSICHNSDITLEAYRLNDLTWFSILVYLMELLMIMTLPLLIQMMLPPLKKLTGLRINAFTASKRALVSSIFAALLVVMAGYFGIEKEQEKANVLANRLSMERDLTLELTLKMQEDKIASDQFLATFSAMRNSEYVIRNRILDYHLTRLSQDYDLAVSIFTEKDKTPESIAYLTGMMSGGTAIADGSRIRFHRDPNGNTLYTGSFAYYIPGSGVNMMLLMVSPKAHRESNGYAALLGYTAPGDVVIPSGYSYAKYLDLKMTSVRGSYAYPTILEGEVKTTFLEAPLGIARINKYVHFINHISADEHIIISRPEIYGTNYLIAFLFFALIIYIMLTALTLVRRKKRVRKKNYYKSKINAAMMVALVMTLIAMASASVTFVYKRNNANQNSSMAEKINTLQSLIQARCRFAHDHTEITNQILDDVADITKSDITLYTPGGKEFLSTDQEVFERMLIESRMDETAYSNLVYKNRRYDISHERIGMKKSYVLYAPVFNAQGNMIAILASPFTEDSFDFKSEAVLHSISIITVFLILLIIARLVTARAVEKMFKPLSEMGEKMNTASIENLEYIIYEREDEVSSLVRAYNLMVHDLYESTKQLATTERDKAWATMARQVAHEIKNPLTPIKLQIQRLIRMKGNGNPAWADRFDEISIDVLKQIDILADTANEFSTFARLYTEVPVEIDLDKLIKEEIELFDSKDNISFSYMGLDGAKVMGPKPQLTRVFTNLIGNAVQAVENAQEEAAAKGLAPEQGNVLVSVRYSSKEGCYDIVFEDNGPGVSDENRARLFTPNFTTKSNGTGLGLSICRNILEKCNADISYSRSFSLKGACFTIRYPITLASPAKQ